MTSPSSSRPTLYSIGHSKHPEQKLLDLLTQHGIEALADVRSQPFSRFNPHFNQKRFSQSLAAAGIRYLYLGQELGGRPTDEQFLDEAGQPVYQRIAKSPAFRAGIDRLEQEAADHIVAMMCSEENPADCHRHLLIAPVVNSRGIDVLHIRGDGRLESEEQVASQSNQRTLF